VRDELEAEDRPDREEVPLSIEGVGDPDRRVVQRELRRGIVRKCGPCPVSSDVA